MINISELKNKSINLLVYLTLFIQVFLQSCTDKVEIQIRVPAIELYQKAMVAYEDEFYIEALKNFENLIEEYSGTRLATLSHLKMGDLYFLQQKWEESESSYRRFLMLNPRTHLTPYILNRLIVLNYERNLYGLFVKSRDYDRNMEPNRTLIADYQRFYLLFPQSPYLQEVESYKKRALSDLAEHELHVANYYFNKEAYHSAIGRYLYLLKNYPSFPNTIQVAERLIEAYLLNQQFGHADEMKKVLKTLRERKLLAGFIMREE